MEIRLKEGEEIKVKADNDNPEAYRILVCHNRCILLKNEVEAVKPTICVYCGKSFDNLFEHYKTVHKIIKVK